MNKVILLSVLLTAIVGSNAQTGGPVIKMYAYSQMTLGGAAPAKGVDENGREIEMTPEKKPNHFLYFTYSKHSSVVIKDVWINGKQQAFTAVAVTKTPIEVIAEANGTENKKIALVPATSKKVVQLVLMPNPKSAKSKPLPSLYAKQKKIPGLIVSYMWKGKKYYTSLNNVKVLEPVAAM